MRRVGLGLLLLAGAGCAPMPATSDRPHAPLLCRTRRTLEGEAIWLCLPWRPAPISPSPDEAKPTT